ncbi:MAG: UDP-N-acetylglucosamine 1-carboxyvinyltransferase, partial [Candidatus Omnitrophica bacterium]|nr:UDP-N-acetylglucosamine 1-carboxyvinyltransferase [Candidatus Omnitrophota bacterium]MBD3268636.1 UDP-N-acetylglucosamine 1-carboxyvinyltransferase [Candidatus Omnitrophota bacterium]
AFGSSVLATANVLMASVFNPGEVIIEHAACEPEIICLAHFMKAMGARISGEGTPLITVKGVTRLNGCEFSVIPDRIEAGTFIAAALATKSHITIEGVETGHLTSVLNISEQIGATLALKNNSSIDIRADKLRPVNITTLPYPGFPTDLQAQFMSCLCFAKGTSLITEKIYPDRFMHVAELNRMGASIQRSGPYAIIEGKQKLYGAETMASDLRASAALVVGALAAEGKSQILRVYHIDRGYENIENKFNKLGAKVKRV